VGQYSRDVARHCNQRAALKNERRRQAVSQHSNVVNLLSHRPQLAVHDGHLLALGGDLAADASKTDAGRPHDVVDVRDRDEARR